jgi:diguanylate cyclase (GGDEF)-like protein
MNGMGVAKDYAEALRWLQQADDQGNADAETIIKHLYTNDADLLSLLKPTPVTSEVALAIYERFDDEVELLSDRDALTGILNRSAMLHALKANIDNVRAQRRMGTGGVSLIIIGLGNFAQSSGDSGPSFQDAVLFGLADRLADNLRQTDSLGRMASEEFAVCAPGATLRNATALAQRLRQAVAAEPFDTPLGRLPITVHVGVAALQADDSILSLLERAHAAMCSARKLVDFMAPTSRGLDVL